MAIEFYSSIDLNKNELQNAALQVLGTKPGSPVQGQIFFDSDVTQVQVYNGSAWQGLVTEVVDTDDIFNTGLRIGRDSHNMFDFETADNTIDIYLNNAKDFTFTANTFTAQSGSTIAAQALTATTGVFSGILKTDDTTAATSTTDGSLQTDGGLSVALDAVIGDDLILISDAAILSLGADKDVKLTHDNGTGGALASTGNFLVDSTGGSLTLDGHDGLTLQSAADIALVAGGNDITIDSDTLVITSSTADYPLVKLLNTTNDDQASQLYFEKLRADDATAQGQNLGEIWFRGQNDNQQFEEYGFIIGEIDVGTDGQESGVIKIGVAAHDGDAHVGLEMTGAGSNNTIDMAIGFGTSSVTTLAGTLTMGSTAAMGNTGLLTVGAQTGITATANLVTVGALNSGTITSGFGNIDNGSSTFDTGAATVASLVLGGHSIDDIDITAEFVDADAHIMSSKAIGARFSLKAGSTSIVTTGVLNAGSINTSFGNINNGASTITTTGLISGGSLDIDDVLINGSNIGHTDDTDLIALADGAVTVNGSLTVTGTTTTNNVETVSTSSGVIFEGAAADGHDATLKSVVASSDKTYTLPNVTGHVALFAADPSTTTITSTPAELNKLDGATVVVGEINALDLGSTAVGNAIASKAVVLDSSKDFTGINSLGSDNYVVGGHTIDDIDITAEFVDADAHIMSSKAIGARFAQKNADTTGTATNSVHVLVTDNENTDEENQITFIEGAGGGGAQRGLEADGHLTYNPSSGTVTATIFKGNIDAVDGDFDGTLETDALTTAGTAIVAQATASAVGGVELATAAEVLTGTDTARVVTADTLAARSVVAIIDVSSLTDANIVTIPHNLGTADVMVQVYDATTEANIMCDIARTTDDFSTASTSSISIDFGTAPPNDCRCLITSLKGASASGTVAYT